MTDLLEKALEAAKTMPTATQDDIARFILQIAGVDQPMIELTPDEIASFAEARGQAARDEFVPDEQVRALWAKHGL